MMNFIVANVNFERGQCSNLIERSKVKLGQIIVSDIQEFQFGQVLQWTISYLFLSNIYVSNSSDCYVEKILLGKLHLACSSFDFLLK